MSNKKQALENKNQVKSQQQQILNVNNNMISIQIDDNQLKQQSKQQEIILELYDSQDFMDSLSSQDDSQDQNQQQQQQEQNLNQAQQLIKINEKLFSNLRGAHSQVEIAKLPRLGKSSYVYYDEKQKFNNQFQNVLNRFYKSIPYDDEQMFDESQCKTKFHYNLFEFEDNRIAIDDKLLYLQKQLKLQNQNQNVDMQSSIQMNIEELRQKKNLLEIQQEQEKFCFYLSIDQQYHQKFEENLKCLTPRYFQIQSEYMHDLMEQNKNQSFSIYPYLDQPQWLLQYQKNFNILKQKKSKLLPPLYFYSFQDKNALMITSQFILKSLQKNNKNQAIPKIFKDLIKILFEIDVPEQNILFNANLLNVQIVKILLSQKKQNLPDLNQYFKPFPPSDDPFKKKNQVNFYPNILPEEYIIYGRPIFECSLRMMYEIYLRVLKITQIKTKITYQNKEYIIGNLLFELFYSTLEEQISNLTWLTICKSIFNEKDSIEISSLIKLVGEFLKIFYKYEKFTLELLKNKIYNILGKKSQMVTENVDVQKINASELLKQYKMLLKNRMMARVQSVDGLMIIHVFRLN